MTTPQTPEQMAAECKRLASEFGKAVVRVSHGVTGDNIEALMAAEQALGHSIDSLAALAASAQQEPVGEVVGHHKIGYTASLPTIRWSDRYWPAVGTKLYAAPVASEPVQAPPGWQMVPVVPTRDMISSGVVNTKYQSCTVDQVYSAMLAAAPSHGAAQAEPSPFAAPPAHAGWPPGMLQDDSRELSKALAGQPGALLHAKEAARVLAAPPDAVVKESLSTQAPADVLAEAMRLAHNARQAPAGGPHIEALRTFLAAHLRAAPKS